jgi:hypothetical protein
MHEVLGYTNEKAITPEGRQGRRESYREEMILGLPLVFSKWRWNDISGSFSEVRDPCTKVVFSVITAPSDLSCGTLLHKWRKPICSSPVISSGKPTCKDL